MEFKKLGNSDINVSVLAFGAWAAGGWQWGGSDTKDAIRAIETAVDHGMTSIDTAPIYGFGLSEEIVGKAVTGKRNKVQILTKFGMIWGENKGEFFFKSKDNSGNDINIHKYSGKQRIIEDCEKSLKRLRTDYIDLYQAHWPDATTPVSEPMEALQVLLKQGKIRAGGVSNYSPGLMAEAEKIFPIASDQVAYSMVNRGIENEIVPHCIRKNIGILAYSPLQRGLLAGSIKAGHKFNEGDTRPGTLYYREPNLTLILKMTEKLKEIADARKVTLSQLVLNWTMLQPGITCVLSGARNDKQVLENIRAAGFRLSDEELASINSLLAELKLETKI